jgi:tRNA(Arg) A34 adenosine deaminase TadA
MYVNLRPCLQCLAIAKAAGVRRIYFGEDWRYPDEIEAVYRTLSAEFESFTQMVPGADSQLPGALAQPAETH